MKLKFLAILGVLVMFSSNATYTKEGMKEIVQDTVFFMKRFRTSRAAPCQEEFLREKGGADAYFDNAGKVLSNLADLAISETNPKENIDALAVVLKDIYELGEEISTKVSQSSGDDFIQRAFGILDHYYLWHGECIESENDPRLLEYIDYLGYAVCMDWRVGS